jgi:nucleotide-binding universal stress UspA family protein
MHTRPGAYLAGLAESLRAATNLGVSTRTVSGVSIADPLRSVCQGGARALVMVRTQRSGLSRLLSGSVADELIGQLPVPLLVVP